MKFAILVFATLISTSAFADNNTYYFQDDGGEHAAGECVSLDKKILTIEKIIMDDRLKASIGYIGSALEVVNPSGADIYRHYYGTLKNCENASFALNVLQGFIE